MGEGRVDDDRDLRVRMVAAELGDGFLQLFQARQGAALGGDVGAVDDDVLNGHVLVVKHRHHCQPAIWVSAGDSDTASQQNQGRLGTSVWA